ncbi:MAG: hypothetical protein PHG76_11195 [Eubacteriales bacterium]|nr:hypothetical protein [Eubacteriales bacterium]
MTQKLSLVFSGITAVCLLLLVAFLVIGALVYVPRINQAVEGFAETAIDLKAMQDAMDDFAAAAEQLKTIDFENINRLVQESRDSVTAAGEKIEQIDIATLNDAISNLNDTIEPLARFFNVFR